MLEGLGCGAAMGTCVVGELTPPVGMCCKIAVACSHLMYPAGYELVEGHEGVWGQAGLERVVGRGRAQGIPLMNE